MFKSLHKNKISCTNEYRLDYASRLKLLFGIVGFVCFAAIVLIITEQGNYSVAMAFIGIYLFVILALCYERDMIVRICEDGFVITKIATIYQKEKKLYIPYNDINNIYAKTEIGFNYIYEVYVINYQGNKNIKLPPINKENNQLKLYLEYLNLKLSNNNVNYAKSNENVQKKEKISSIWKIICLILFFLIGILFRIIFR